MNKIQQFIAVITINILLMTLTAQAQKSDLHLIDFSGANGSNPQGSLISDGTYLYGMTSTGGGNSHYGTIFKVKTDGTSYQDMLDFIGGNGSTPYGSLLPLGTYLYGMTSAGGTSGNGLVFKITFAGTGYDTIMNFNGTNGSSPYGSLISDGTYLYGMTNSGGVNGYGTVFKVKPDKTGYQKLLDFNNTNGSYPQGTLFYDGTYLYGMTSSGGVNNYGNIFKIKPDGTGYLDLMDFSSTTGNYPYGSLISDGTYLYGMTSSGGNSNSGIIFKIKPDGTGYTSVLDFNVTNGSSPQGDLIINSGVLYGMTSGGGMNYYGNIFKINTDGTNYTNLYNFDNTNGSYPNGALYFDGTFVYGTTHNGGTNGDGTVFKFNPTCSTITLTSAVATDAQTVCYNSPITNIKYQCSGSSTNVTGLPDGVTGTASAGVLTISGTPTVTGNYTYTVTTKGASGCSPDSSMVSGSIFIQSAPTANIDGATTTICQNNQSPVITFTGSTGSTSYTNYTKNKGGVANSSGGIYIFTYKINGGSALQIISDSTYDGEGGYNYSNSASLSASTNTAGSFTYSLVSVQQGACLIAQSGSDTVIVKPLPIMTSANSATICTGSTVNIPLTANVVSTYTWIASDNLNTAGESTTMQSTTTLTNTITNPSSVSQIVTYTVTPSNSCGTGFPQVVNVSVDPSTIAGTVGSSATICSGDNSGILSLSGQTGNVLNWQYSTNGGSSYTNVANTAASQSYLNLAATTQYRAVVKSGVCNTLNSSAVILTVNPVSVGGTVSSSATVCSGTNTGTLTLSGQTGSVVKWQKSIDGGTTYSDISNTTTSQTYSNLTATTLYRAVVQSGVCSTANSSAATITVNPVSVGGTISSSSTVCSGNNSGVLSLSGQTGNVLKWQSSVNGGSTFTDISNTAVSQSFIDITATTLYRALVQSGVCSSINSSTVTITVNPVSVGGNVSSNTTVCSGANTGTLTLSGQTGNIVKWQKSIDGGTTYSDITNTTASQTYSNLTATTLYRAVVQNGVCATANSSAATITVNPISVGGTISSSSTVCSGNNSGVLSLSGQTGNVLKWQSSVNGGSTFTDISNTATSQSYLNNSLTTLYRAVVQSGVCAAANSSTVTITVNPASVGGTLVSSATVCYGVNSGTLTLSGQTGTVLKWQNSIDGGATYTDIPNTGLSQSYSNITTPTLYRAVVKSGVCLLSANSSLAAIKINALPLVKASATASTICLGASTKISGSGAVSYSWSGGIQNNTSFNPSGSQTYTVIGTDANGCSNKATINIKVNSLPVVTATATKDTVCQGSAVILRGGGATSYTWTGGVTDKTSFTPQRTNTYTVTGKDINSCSNTAKLTIVVDTLPQVSIISTNESAVNSCDGYLEAVVVGKANASYNFVWSDSTSVNSKYRYKVCNGTYSVTVSDSIGCTVTKNAHIGSNTTPIVTTNPLTISVSSSSVSADAKCDGTATIRVTGGQAPYKINFGGTITNGSSVTVNNFCAGFYTVNVTDAKSDSSSFTFVIGSPSTVFTSVDPHYADSTIVGTKVTSAIPNCTISYDNIDSIKITGYTYIGHDSINASWTIYQGTGNTVINTQYAKYGNIQSPGVYVLELDLYCTNRTSGSIRATDDIYVDSRLADGIASIETDDNTIVYPNPFNTTINIVGDKNAGVRITDVSGKEIYAYTINSYGKLTIDTESLNSGIYFLIITNNQTVITKKVIKN